jgi:Rieske 2Fe-2S family protein
MERTLHRDFYFSEEIFGREVERIFCREWFCAGREEDWPDPGDYRALDIVGESVLVVRTREGRLAAHYNVCRHRRFPAGTGGRPRQLHRCHSLPLSLLDLFTGR